MIISAVEYLSDIEKVRGSIPLSRTKQILLVGKRLISKIHIRSVAQSGSAPGLGPGGPRFESLYSDQSFFKRGNSMTCRGYDSRTVKLPQAVKRAATLIRDAHKRGDFIRSFVEIEKSNSRSPSRKDSSK